MEITTVSLIISIVAFLLGLTALIKTSRAIKDKPEPLPTPKPEGFDATTLRLQAYERLVLLTERIALPNLISRLNQPGISAYEMKVILTENIKHEYDYNNTQQLYVSQISWDSVRNLKEQNIMVVNQVAASLPPEASASDLNKKILEVIMAQPNGDLHELVLQALNHEANKLMR